MCLTDTRSLAAWPSASRLLRHLLLRLLAVILSLLAALAVCELALRLFNPKYDSLARQNMYAAHESRIWAMPPNASKTSDHPDSGRIHAVTYNQFGSRQHRNFPVDALEHADNIAFFGDSNVANVRLEAQYSFTEPLDFLLNLQDRSSFNVLGFGIDGYGPGQQFIWYERFPHSEELDHVVYVFCDNDIQNFHDHGLFSLDDVGNLVANVAYQRGVATAFLSRLHLSYLVLDAEARLDAIPIYGPQVMGYTALLEVRQRIIRRKQSGTAFVGDAFDGSIAAFQALLLDWKARVEAHGNEFHVAVLPYMSRSNLDMVLPASLDVLYLQECFSRLIPNYDYSDWRFQADAHLSEAGNMVVAHCLYRFLEEKLALPRLSDAALAEARYEYYRAVSTSGWMPPPAWAARPKRNAHNAADIVSKYMALDESPPAPPVDPR